MVNLTILNEFLTETYSLALCELYLVTAALALRVLPQLKLFDTTYEDIKYDFDALTPQPKKGARGVRVTTIQATV